MPHADRPRDHLTAPVLLGGLSLRVALFEGQIRAELLQQTPGGPPVGRLVWQHHRPVGTPSNPPTLLLPGVLARSAAYLDAKGWPGVAFKNL
jgi:hypothetical protein